MKPTDMTTFGAPGGNCFSACVASILEIPVEEVPYFMTGTLDPKDMDWLPKFTAWLKPRGLYPLVLSKNSYVPGIHFLGGKSPRVGPQGRGYHAVVAVGDTIIHDPHPSRKGILDVFQRVVLVPYEPQRVI